MTYILSSAMTAERISETGRAYTADLDDIKVRQGEIWVKQKEILQRLNKVLDVAK